MAVNDRAQFVKGLWHDDNLDEISGYRMSLRARNPLVSTSLSTDRANLSRTAAMGSSSSISGGSDSEFKCWNRNDRAREALRIDIFTIGDLGSVWWLRLHLY